MVTRQEHFGPEISERSMSVSWRDKLVRIKGNLDPASLIIVMTLGGLPLLMVLCRFFAFPGVEPPDTLIGGVLYSVGVWLNQTISLEWVPSADRPEILYILLLPTGALLITLARLTFGLRVMGFRAILIAIGFQIAGVLPSLVLMAFVISATLMIRPWMRRIKLPLFARIAVILCLAAMIMIGALLLAPLLRSDIVWSVAFFPIIIIAMLGEGVAKTMAKDNVLTAVWRAGWTVVVALVIALVCTRPTIREVAVHFPELLLTQLVMIILIAEFLDLRLLEHWPDRLTRLTRGKAVWRTERPIVAVVRNRWNTGVIGRLGRPAPSKYRKRSVQRVVNALRERGFLVKVFEGDINLLRALNDLMPANVTSGLPGGLVMNLASGVQGAAGFSQIPAMLELAGVAYTGPGPAAQMSILDRHVLLTLLQRADIPVPRFRLISGRDMDIGDLSYPLAVRPRAEAGRKRVVVKNSDSLIAAVASIHESLN
ncbi:MAG: 7TM domain-containing protein, partial [Gammaproteobacteria bacterium]